MVWLWQYIKMLRLTEISFSDVIDILIISYVIYQLFLLLKGTRAAKMATGIAFLVLFYFVAKLAHLRTIQWFLTTFVTYAVFGIIVLYQAEIRKILANIGNTRLFRGFSGRENHLGLDEIVLAAMTLSSKRIGALVVIEREIGLRSYTENGNILNAKLSYDLLVTIFQPETPLHDGAVIVQRDTIVAASCFLPLTLEPHLSKEYGTRHRAAIGITEETDAVAVVVSEETGRISAALEGKLVRFSDADSLLAFLTETLQPQTEAFRLPRLLRRKESSS
jgi:diadenylate cyclase